MRDMEQLIREVNGTMAMEGMPLSEADKENLRAILRGEITFEAMKKKILAPYQPKQSEKHTKQNGVSGHGDCR